MEPARRPDWRPWLLLPVFAALLLWTSPETTPADSALILDRAASLQQARAPGSGSVVWPAATVWTAYPLAAAQAILGRLADGESRVAYLTRTEPLWRGLLRFVWALLAAALVLRLATAWRPDSPGIARWGMAAAALAAPVLAVGVGRLLPAVPAALLLGELFARALRRDPSRPRDEWLLGIGAGVLLGWFPFIWVALPILVGLIVRRGGRGAAVGRIVGPALLLALILEPSRLTHPERALLLAANEWQRGGGWTGQGGAGTPAMLALSAILGATAWCLWPVAAWGARRPADRDAAWSGVALWLLAVLVPVLAGVRRPGLVQWSVAPWLLAWGVGGASRLPERWSLRRLAPVLVLGVLVAGTLPARWQLFHQGERGERLRAQLQAELPALLGPHDLCASEVEWGSAGADSLARRLLVLPKDSRAPARYDYVYWARWYAGFRWVLLSGARVSENLTRAEADEARRFYAAVLRDGTLEREWGDRDEGYRLYRIREGSEWQRPFREVELGSFRGRREMSWFLSQLGDRYLAIGEARAVEAISRVGLNWDPDSPALYSNLGVACLRLEDPAEAAKAFEAGLRLAPQSFELLWNLALACVQAHLYPRAESVLRRAVEIRPEYAPAHYELGRVFVAQDKPTMARRAFERYLELDPSSRRRGAVEEVLRRLPAEKAS